MIFSASELAALAGDTINIAVFFRLETNPVVRLWLGFGNIFASSNVRDPDGAVYSGFGEISDIPAFNLMINGAAERVDFTLSGVDGSIAQLAMRNDAQNIKRKRVSIGLGIFDSTWQLLGAPHWLANFRADVLRVEQSPVKTPNGQLAHIITLSCGSLLTMRRRPLRGYFSNADQKTRFPDDDFCSLTPKYANGFNKAWPILSA